VPHYEEGQPVAVDEDLIVEEPAAQPNYMSGLAWNVAFSAVMKVIFAFVAIYIMRRLGPLEIGIYYLITAIYIFAEQMREAGLKQAFYNDNDISPIRFRTYARLSVMSGVTFGIILAAASMPLAHFFRVPAAAVGILWAALGTFLNGLSVIPMAALHKAGRFRDVGLIESAANLVATGVAFAMVLSGWGFEALVAQLVVRAFVQLLLAYWQKPYSIGNYDPVAARGIMRVCTPLVLTDVLWLLYSLADSFAILRLLGTYGPGPIFAATANGFYGGGRRILSFPADLIFTPLHRTVLVALGNRSQDPVHLSRTFMKAICLAVLLLGMLYAVAAILARPIVIAALTDKFAGTIPVFGIICISEAFKMTGTFAGSALVAAGKSKIPLYAWILPYPIAAIGIALTWNRMSLATIAWSYAAGMIVVNVVVIAAAFKHLKIAREQVNRFFQCVLISGITAGIAYGMSFLPLRPWPHVIVAAVTIPIIHALVIGTVIARNPIAYLSRRGAVRLRESL
jgi:O-antigen/teichoic acid export membrane protein